jgi:hypothetical protein
MMFAFIAKSETDQLILMAITLWTTINGYIGMFQATLHSSGIDWITRPSFLIGAWWVLLKKTWDVLKAFSPPIIAASTYFVLFITYHAIMNLS